MADMSAEQKARLGLTIVGRHSRRLFHPLKNFFAYGRIVLRDVQNLCVFRDRQALISDRLGKRLPAFVREARFFAVISRLSDPPSIILLYRRHTLHGRCGGVEFIVGNTG